MPDLPPPIESFSPSDFALGVLSESQALGAFESRLSRTAATYLVDRDDHRNFLRLQFATNEEVDEERPSWGEVEANLTARPSYRWDGSTERVLRLRVLVDDATELGDINDVSLRTMSWFQAAARPSEKWIVDGLDSQWVKSARAAGIAALAGVAAHQAAPAPEGLVFSDLVRPTAEASAAVGAVRSRVIERARYRRVRSEFVAGAGNKGGRLGSVAASVVAAILSRPDTKSYDDFVAFYRDSERRRTAHVRPWPTTDVTFVAVQSVLPEIERQAASRNQAPSTFDVLALPDGTFGDPVLLRYDPWEITEQIKGSAEVVGKIVSRINENGGVTVGSEDALLDSALRSYQDAVSGFLSGQARATAAAKARIQGALDENAGASAKIRRLEGALDIRELDPAFRPAATGGPRKPASVRDDPSRSYFGPARLWLIRPNQPAWPCVIRNLEFEELLANDGIPTRIVADIELVEYVESEADLRVLGFEVDSRATDRTADAVKANALGDEGGGDTE